MLKVWKRALKLSGAGAGIFQGTLLLTLIPAWVSYYIHYQVYDEITYTFPNFIGTAIEVWEWIINFIPHFTGHMITYPCWD